MTQRLSKKYKEKSNGVNPKEFFTSKSKFTEFYNSNTGKREGAPQSSIWMLQPNNRYDLTDKETGEVYITNVDLNTGIQYLVDDKVKTYKGKMTFAYGNNKRSDVKADTTFDAILSGERTATTRYITSDAFGYWYNIKPGDIITWESADGRTVDVRATTRLYALNMSGMTPSEWSKLEGWSVKYFNDNVRSKVDDDTAWQFQYELLKPNDNTPGGQTSLLQIEPALENFYRSLTKEQLNNPKLPSMDDAQFMYDEHWEGSIESFIEELRCKL